MDTKKVLEYFIPFNYAYVFLSTEFYQDKFFFFFMYDDIFSTDMQEYTRVPWKVQNIYPKYSKAYFGFIVHVDLFSAFVKWSQYTLHHPA